MHAATFAVWAALVLSASAAPYGNSTSACAAQYNACRGSGDPNEAQCAAQSASCFASLSATSIPAPTSTGTSQSQYDACRSSGDPNEAACAAQFAACNGSTGNSTTTIDVVVYTTVCPITSLSTSGGQTFTTIFTTTSTITSCKGDCSTQTSSSIVPSTPDCDAVRSACQSQPDSNQAVCATEYAQCASTNSGLNKLAPSATYATYSNSTTTQDCDKVLSDC